MSSSLVFDPAVIIAQFTFRRFIMLKMFLSALGTTSFVFSFLLWTIPEDMSRVRDKRMNTRGAPVVAIGSFILGVGMAIGGACPG